TWSIKEEICEDRARKLKPGYNCTNRACIPEIDKEYQTLKLEVLQTTSRN
ncbi:3346_t:CDS:2, partial [Ambispora leptoticha]